MANVIKNFFTASDLAILQPYCRVRIEDMPSLTDDTQTPLAPNFYNDALATVFHRLKKPLVEEYLNKTLNTTYVYWRYYGYGSKLDMHTDRPSCEWSITACVNKTDDWPLIIKGETVELGIGDALVYNGVADRHGRPGTYQGDGMAQIFMHYVDANGRFAHHSNDEYLKQTGSNYSVEDKELMPQNINQT